MSTEKSPYWKTFRKSVRAILRQKRMSQKELAEAIGCRSTTLSAWLSESESAKSPQKFPNAEYLFKMADTLKVSLDKLMGRKTPGSEILEDDRVESRRRTQALDQILPDEFDSKPAPPGRKQPAKAKKKKTSGRKKKKKQS